MNKDFSNMVYFNVYTILGQLFTQYGVDLNEQANLFPSSNTNYPLNLGDGWSDQKKINMLLYLVSCKLMYICFV